MVTNQDIENKLEDQQKLPDLVTDLKRPKALNNIPPPPPSPTALIAEMSKQVRIDENLTPTSSKKDDDGGEEKKIAQKRKAIYVKSLGEKNDRDYEDYYAYAPQDQRLESSNIQRQIKPYTIDYEDTNIDIEDMDGRVRPERDSKSNQNPFSKNGFI